jgi:hypothetical protein
MIFLSYAREDAGLVGRLEGELLEFGVPILKDSPKTESSPFWRNTVAKLLDSASAVLIFWTKNAIASPWVDQEIRAWAGKTIWFQYDMSPIPRFLRAENFICDDWHGLMHTLRSFTRQPRFQMNRKVDDLYGACHWRRVEAYKCAEETLAVFRRRRFKRRRFARIGEHLLQDQSEGLLFREIHPGIYIAECSVTRDQYQRFVAETGFPANRYVESATGSGHLPVTSVSWYEAMAYCEWFGGTLPSEQEWEMAASTMRGFKYATVTGAIEPTLANYGGSFDSGSPAPQRSFPPNPDGFFGLCGNTWDWCRTPARDYRIIRGGSWIDSERFCTTTSRYRNAPVDRDCSVGFRVRLLAT